MASINRQVWRLLDSDLSIQQNLRRGIVNIRGLAKFLIKRNSLQSSVDAVISAIRRYEVETDFDQLEGTLKSILKDATLSTRNNLIAITASDKAKKEIPQFFKKQSIYVRDRPRIVTGRAEVKIIVTKEQLSEILDTIGKANVLHLEENLSELGLVMQKEAVKTKGVIARITNELAMNNINISELIICPPEIFCYVAEKDMLKAHESVMKLIQ